MKLPEAIATSLAFRRPCFPAGLWYFYHNKETSMSRSDGQHYCPDRHDICADDWEVKEVQVTITKKQLMAALNAFIDLERRSAPFVLSPFDFVWERLEAQGGPS